MADKNLIATLYASQDNYNTWSVPLEKLGLDIMKGDPTQSERCKDPTLHVGTNWYDGDRSISHYVVNRARRLGINPDTL
jgi:hypothetical protein